MTPMRRKFALLSLALFAGTAQADYLQPPEPLLGVMRAPLIPAPTRDPTGTTLLLVKQSQFPPIERVAEPYLKLAGVRVEPRLRARHDMASGYGIRTCLEGFSLLDIASRKETPVALPEGACPDWPSWSPDGRRFAFANTTEQGVELWVGETSSGTLRRIEGVRLNPILEHDAAWLAGSDRLLVKLIPESLGDAPRKSPVPLGPEIKEAAGEGESSTYEARDTLSGPADEALFDYYATSQLAVVDLVRGNVEEFGEPAVHGNVAAAPDGRHVRVQTLKRPYSYVVTWERFAYDLAIHDLEKDERHLIASVPAAESVPVWGVPIGPREFQWRADEPATLLWAEALDGGDWKSDAPQRDKVLQLRAPFTGVPAEIARTQQRFSNLSWFEQGSRALLSEYDANKRTYRVSLTDISRPKRAAKVLWDLSWDEKYANPGNPVFRSLRNGYSVLHEDKGAIFLRGQGATPQGNRPFFDRFDLASGKTERLFRSDKSVLETAFAFAGDTSRLLTWRQSPQDPPNAFVRTVGDARPNAPIGEAVYESSLVPITDFSDPAPLVRQVKKKLVTYKRKDGVDLSFTLYTPPGYKEGERLPAILYAYPLDYADPKQAGQVSDSDRNFVQLSEYQLLLLAGYAIIDNASFPIVGDPKNAYDTYVEQLVDNARAAVDKAVELGVVDRERIGVTGHSHGALMAANLLAHTDLFRAGAATSGGYNKTLTPFGFQSERRSYWQAPEVYAKVSAFHQADKIDEPLLIVHGADDANPGTEATQAPRLFQAIRGSGGVARLVTLPFEPHWYTARESKEHLVAEHLAWFDRYVKHATPREEKKK